MKLKSMTKGTNDLWYYNIIFSNPNVTYDSCRWTEYTMTGLNNGNYPLIETLNRRSARMLNRSQINSL